MSRMHAILRRATPDLAKRAVGRLREFLDGPGLEAYVLRPYRFVPDPDPRPRISLVLTSLSAREAFGGVTTGIDIAFALARTAGIDLRIVSEYEIEPTDNVLDRYPEASGTENHFLLASDLALPTRRNEIFLPFNWWVSLNLEPVLHEQARHFGVPLRPKVPLIQEYEPHFYPFSATHLLALEAFNGEIPIWGVFNSTELFDYYAAQGNRHDRAYVFQPRLNGALKPFLDGLGADLKRRTALIYGRPKIPRNAFFLVRRGLEIWAERYGADHRDWRLLSAGAAHPPVDLGNGIRLASVGKLSLEDYGALLRETAIGVSLMSSPHPSYPPLEMAHFGARVITNAYANKRLENRHENIVSLPAARPEALAEAFEAEIAAFEASPGHAAAGRSHMPNYLSDAPYECLGPLARDVSEILKD